MCEANAVDANRANTVQDRALDRLVPRHDFRETLKDTPIDPRVKFPYNDPDYGKQANANTQVNQTPRMLLKNLEQRTVDLIMVKEKEMYELQEMLRALQMASALLG